MEQITLILAIIAGLVPLFALVKILTELSAIPTIRDRSQYEFAYTLAQRSSDPILTSYALELGYKTLINDAKLSTQQRKALLTLPDRVVSIPHYLKARRLLKVQLSGPVLRWKFKRHGYGWYRKSLMGVLWILYVVFASSGFFTLLVVYPKTFSLILNNVLEIPPYISLFLIFLGAFSLYHSLTLSTAENLVDMANAVGPFPQ